MQKKIEIVAYLHIAYGALILLAAFMAFISIAGGGLLSGEAEAIFVTAGVGFAVSAFLALLALPSIFGGYGLLKRKEWARVLIIVLSFIDLLSFPFGTALGIYSLWVLNKPEVREMFHNGQVYHS